MKDNTAMKLSDFSYNLPEELIGQEPIEPRDSCKLLVLDRKTGDITHRLFSDLPSLIDSNTVLVLNDTKVFPARLYGRKDTGGKVEILLLKQLSLDSYECLGKGTIRVGQSLVFSSKLSALVVAKDEEGIMTVKFSLAGTELLLELDHLGRTPLPPYIHSSAKEKTLREKYQTVYARYRGSAAAPTAGLHFTDSLLSRLKNQGVEIEKVTLHVGLGTFKPVTSAQIESQTLHSEHFVVTPETAQRLNQAKEAGKKILAVGTTACRTLESASDHQGKISSGEGETSLFIQPGYRYKFVDGLITNFHLPETSLLMLVTALTTKPNSPAVFKNFSDSPIGLAYQEAVKNRYRFFSFGDAMIII